MFELLEKLCLANAPSGCEDEVVRLITRRLDELSVPYTIYPSGNVITSLPSEKPNAPSIMVQCHMDEVGFMVKGHRDGGYLSLSPLGISDTTKLVGKRVTVLAEKQLSGSVGAVPIHLSKDKDTPAMDELYVDVGITSKSDAAEKLSLGTFGCFDNTFKYFGKDESYISGKALSSRVPCSVMLEVINRLKDTPLNAKVHFAFTVRGNLSLNGAAEAYNKIRPDAVISVTGITADDTPDSFSPICRLGDGTVLSRGEIRYRYDEFLTAQLSSAAKDNGISCQASRPLTEDEDSDFSILRMKNAGARIAVVKLPVRNIRSSCEVVAKSDARNAADLLLAVLPTLEV